MAAAVSVPTTPSPDIFVELHDADNNSNGSDGSSNNDTNNGNNEGNGGGISNSSSRRRRITRHRGDIRNSQARRALNHLPSSGDSSTSSRRNNSPRPPRTFSNHTATSAAAIASSTKSGGSSCPGADSDEEVFSISGSKSNSNSNRDDSTKLFEADARRSTREWAESQLKQQTQAILDQDEDFHLNKLNWNDVPLVGRDDFIQSMIENYHSMISKEKFHKILSIHGKSGTGKSKLALKLKDNVVVDSVRLGGKNSGNGGGEHGGGDVGFFCVGKFDVQHQQASPYRGFVAAMDEIVNQILNIQNVRKKAQILENLSQAISDRDVPVLLPIIPGLIQLFSSREPAEAQQPQKLTANLSNKQLHEPSGALSTATSSAFRKSTTDIAAAATTVEDDVVDTSKRQKQLQYLFRKFAHAVCCVHGSGRDDTSDTTTDNPTANTEDCIPFVLMLDDMQWADQPSMDLVESLSMEDGIPFLLVMTSRDDETPSDRPFSQMMRTIQHERGISVLDIHLENLTVEDVNVVVSKALRDDEESTLPLAEEIHQKSYGNPLYVTQFLQSLFEEELLSYNVGTMSWIWDIATIDGVMQVTDNVAGLLTRKIQRVSPKCQMLLQAAACLGEEIEEAILALAYDIAISITITTTTTAAAVESKCNDNCCEEKCGESDDDYEVKDSHTDLFDEAEMAGFLHRVGNDKLAFVHDQIQNACYRMIPDHQLERMELEIGKNIFALSKSTGNEQHMFLALDLCNSGVALLDGNDKFLLARDNLAAANRAMDRSAFASADAYLEKGLLLLRCDGDDDQRKSVEIDDLIFELSLVGCEACYCIGRYGRMEEHMNAVMFSKKTIESKVRMYLAKIASSGAQERFEDAISTGLNLLSELGTAHLQPSPGKAAVAKEFRLTTNMLKKFDRDALLALPEMKDEKYIISMGAVDQMWMYTLSTQPSLFAISFMRSVRWSLQFGVCKYSPSAFATFAMLLQTKTGDFKRSEMFGEVALALAARLNARTTLSKTTLCVYTVLHHWTRDMKASARPYMYGFQVGMETGDVDSAMLCLANHDLALLLTGFNLPKVEEYLARHSEKMMEYKQASIARFMHLFQQFCQNLMGNASGDPFVLTGVLVDEDDLYRIARDSKNALLECFVGCYRLQLAFIFGNYELAGEICNLQAVIDFGVKVNEGEMIVPRHFLFRGLSALAMVQKGGSWKNVRHYRCQASEVLKTMKKWHESGNVNISYMVTLLEAEWAIANKKTRKANPITLFKKAILVAGRAGCIHDRALIHDRAGRYHLSVDGNDKYWASYHFDNAIQCYKQWGAVCIAEKLSKEHSEILQTYKRTAERISERSAEMVLQ